MLYKFLRIKKTSQKFEEEPDDDTEKKPQEFEESKEEPDDDTDSEYDNYGFNKYGIHKDNNLL